MNEFDEYERRWFSKSHDEIIREFKKNAKTGNVLGNDFSRLSTVRDKSLCPYLRRLSERLPKLVPSFIAEISQNWIAIVCAWFEEGGIGLERLCKQHEETDPFVSMSLDVLAANRCSESIVVMGRLLPKRFKLPTNRNHFETQAGWCRSVAKALGNGDPIALDEVTTMAFRNFAHALITKGIKKSLRFDEAMLKQASRRGPLVGDVFYFGPGFGVLRFVGNEESIELIESLPAEYDVVRGQRQDVVAAIHKLISKSTTKQSKRRTKKSPR